MDTELVQDTLFWLASTIAQTVAIGFGILAFFIREYLKEEVWVVRDEAEDIFQQEIGPLPGTYGRQDIEIELDELNEEERDIIKDTDALKKASKEAGYMDYGKMYDKRGRPAVGNGAIRKLSDWDIPTETLHKMRLKYESGEATPELPGRPKSDPEQVLRFYEVTLPEFKDTYNSFWWVKSVTLATSVAVGLTTALSFFAIFSGFAVKSWNAFYWMGGALIGSGVLCIALFVSIIKIALGSLP